MLHEKKNVETPKKETCNHPGKECYPRFQISGTTWRDVSGLRVSTENSFCIGYNRPIVFCFQSEQDFPLKG